jgi:hypothetical protein
VHRDKGRGLSESIYEWYLIRELELRHLAATSQAKPQMSTDGNRLAQWSSVPQRIKVLFSRMHVGNREIGHRTSTIGHLETESGLADWKIENAR